VGDFDDRRAADGERQQTGIINLEGGFQAVTPAYRPSCLDPLLSAAF
jgi:hypothetical protein